MLSDEVSQDLTTRLKLRMPNASCDTISGMFEVKEGTIFFTNRNGVGTVIEMRREKGEIIINAISIKKKEFTCKMSDPGFKVLKTFEPSTISEIPYEMMSNDELRTKLKELNNIKERPGGAKPKGKSGRIKAIQKSVDDDNYKKGLLAFLQSNNKDV
jgi:hypothetical protein